MTSKKHKPAKRHQATTVKTCQLTSEHKTQTRRNITQLQTDTTKTETSKIHTVSSKKHKTATNRHNKYKDKKSIKTGT